MTSSARYGAPPSDRPTPVAGHARDRAFCQLSTQLSGKPTGQPPATRRVAASLLAPTRPVQNTKPRRERPRPSGAPAASRHARPAPPRGRSRLGPSISRTRPRTSGRRCGRIGIRHRAA